ncbi:MAG: hypothetical protein RI894_396 [Bacteroidota bacterium]|jgi:uncharacterized protein YuzE
MKVKYDLAQDILRIRFSEELVAESDESKNGSIIIDYDVEGNIIGIEILDASKNVNNPKLVEYEVAA